MNLFYIDMNLQFMTNNTCTNKEIFNFDSLYDLFGNNSLSIVVLTQKRRCNMIPKRNNVNNIYMNFIRENNEIIYAPIIVNTTSTIARFIKRYE